MSNLLVTPHQDIAAVQQSDGTWALSVTGEQLRLLNGKSYIDSARHDYALGNVNSSTWVQLISLTTSIAQGLYIFDSSGYTMELGFGIIGSETRKFLIQPGGPNGFVPLLIPAGTRLSVRAISTTADAGEIDITLLG